MHICKFSYLKGSIRVTLSWWQLKGLLFFCVSKRLMNIPMLASYEACVQVENTSCNAQTVTAVSATWIGLAFHQKQITCDGDYRLVKVALFWYITEFSCSLSPLLLLAVHLIEQHHRGTKIKSPLFYYLLNTLIASAYAALKPCLFSQAINVCTLTVFLFISLFCKAIFIW